MDEQNQTKIIRYGIIAIVAAILLGVGSGVINLILSQDDDQPSRIPFGQSEFPDLIIQNIDGPEIVAAGETATYTVDIVNLKCCRSGDFEVIVILNDGEIRRETLGSLLDDESTTFEFDVTFDEAGDYALLVLIESRSETNLDNNSGVMTITVTQ
ncbi:MAG: hypothetical protein L0154_13930 [Chloroflexi bacterium]|nr:hypothetical protein [Chloroflexota bacterium]